MLSESAGHPLQSPRRSTGRIRMSGLSELIAKLEGLSGPNYEVGRLLTEKLGYPNVYRQPDGTIPVLSTVPAFTSSLDAAVTLVERVKPGALWSVHSATVGRDCGAVV